MAFEVATAADLQKVGTGEDGWNLDSDYIQIADIDMTGVTWTPIGKPASELGYFYTHEGELVNLDQDTTHEVIITAWFPFVKEDAFTGTYDGQGYTIRNLTCDHRRASLFGCFGFEGQLVNINLINIDINITTVLEGEPAIGAGLVGVYVEPREGSKIYNCFVHGNLNIEHEEGAGGLLVGTCLFDYEDVEIPFHIEKCGSVGEITTVGDWIFTGGLIGQAWHNSIITNCYSRANVSGNWAGGLIGLISDAPEDTSPVSFCYAVGEVTGANIGGLIGVTYTDDTIASYYNSDVAGDLDDEGKGEPRSTSQMLDIDTYVGWEFDNAWAYDPDQILYDGYLYVKPTFIEVWSAEDLQKIGTGVDGWRLNCHYKQMIDIDAADIAFEPIGSLENSMFFTGSYNGEGHTIHNLNIDLPTGEGSTGVGLFSALRYEAIVRNIKLSNAHIIGDNKIGAIVGVVYDPGLTSYVYNCLIDGHIEGEHTIGSVVGEVTHNNSNNIATICQCFSLGEILGSGNNVGGIIGKTDENTVVHNCASRSDVEGANYVGGLLGFVVDSNIHRCYAAGALIGTGANIGGAIGHAESSTINYVYYDTELSGMEDTGKGEPLLTEEMIYPDVFDHFPAWDFVSVWDVHPAINDGYPYNRSLFVTPDHPAWFIGDWQNVDWEWEEWMRYWESWPSQAHQWPWSWHDWDWSRELFSITFVVKNFEGDVLPGSTVFLGSTHIGNTDVNGEIVFADVPIQYSITYRVESPGYQTYIGIITFNQFQNHDNYSLTIQVEPEERWIPIYTSIDLYNIRYNLNGKYKLMNNINLFNHPNWLPIGNIDNPFTGLLNGNGCVIRNLQIIDSVYSHKGLFGSINGAVIKTMGVRALTIGGENAAIFTGHCEDALIEECFVTGDIVGSGICGGFASEIVNSDIIKCYSRAEVIGESVGGFAGRTEDSNLLHCYSSEYVEGEVDTGGLIGISENTTFVNCYYDKEVSEQNDTGKGIPVSTEDMQKKATYIDWNFIYIWEIDEDIIGS